MRITIDIETIPDPARSAADFALPCPIVRGSVPSHWKDAGKIAEKNAELDAKYTADMAEWRASAGQRAEEAYRKLSLDIFGASICAIAIKVDGGVTAGVAGQEAECIAWLAGVISGVDTYIQWCGHNAWAFDLPILRLRAAKHGHPALARVLGARRYDVFDTMLEAVGGRGGHAKLDDLAGFLGAGGKTDGVDGSMVYDMWLAGQHEEIRDYCMADVDLADACAVALGV